VALATRTIDANAGRTSVDLSKTKGAFKAVRVSVKAGALALTHIELKYSDGTIRKERRALALRKDQRTHPIGARAEDGFLDSIVLAFRGVAGELDRATILIEGLQSPSGAAASRTQPSSPSTTSPKSKSTESSRRDAAGKKAKRRAAEEAAPSPPPGATEKQARPSTEAAPRATPPAPPEQPVARGAPQQLWDVVPVFYGTDRKNDASIVYGAERARRLELGRALVTVPKVHQVPQIERPWVYRLPFTQIVFTERLRIPGTTSL
jgi:hypothetical protein